MDEPTLHKLLIDLHRDGVRQGPGSDAETLRALALTRLDTSAALKIADIGCGTGAATLTLANKLSNAHITAIDLFPEFLEILHSRAKTAGLSTRVETIAASMDALPCEAESLDLIWSEGAIYNIGFETGIREWRSFLRPNGLLALSEITWLKPNPPESLQKHWYAEYPEIATAGEKITCLETAGYAPLGYFTLPSSCWIDNYYAPTEARIPAFLQRYPDLAEAEELVKMEREECALYQRYADWFSYGFYIAIKR